MLQKADCQKYRKWKKEQTKKLKNTKEKVKGRKNKESTTDCVDEDDVETSDAKPVTKISNRRCKKKRKKTKLPRLMRKIVKYVPSGELILKCIKPSVEDRLYIFNARHNACLGLSQTKIDFVLDDTRTRSKGILSNNYCSIHCRQTSFIRSIFYLQPFLTIIWTECLNTLSEIILLKYAIRNLRFVIFNNAHV